jgi:hypothetical protein
MLGWAVKPASRAAVVYTWDGLAAGKVTWYGERLHSVCVQNMAESRGEASESDLCLPVVTHGKAPVALGTLHKSVLSQAAQGTC